MELLDSDFVSNAIELNPLSEIKIKYHEYEQGYGYFILKNVWKNFNLYVELSEKFPAIGPSKNIDFNNPFLKQPIPKCQLNDFKYILLELNSHIFKYNLKNKNFTITSNIFPAIIDYYCRYECIIPHCDVENYNDILVSNIWLSDGYNGKTLFWKYKDSYTYTKNLYDYYLNIKNPQEIVKYKNFEENNDFKIVGESPCEFGTVTIYNGNQIHSAYVPEQISHNRVSHVVTID